MTADQNKFLQQCAAVYRNDLVDDIMPFWLSHGLDRVNGGVYTCLDRNGNLIDSTKSVWFQGRFGFTAAYAYNHIDRNPDYLAASKSCIDFLEAHCIDTDGHMFFEVAADGTPLRKRRYVFSECFAVIAMAEYARASGDMAYARKALSLFKATLNMLSTAGFLEAKYMPNVVRRGHSITMILVNTALCVSRVVSDPILDNTIERNIEQIRCYFMHPEFEAVLECVGAEGEFIDSIDGRLINPGHAIETAWFLLEVAESRGWDKAIVDTATTILDWSWQWGWDETCGGIINFRDCRNLPPQDPTHDMKYWWPQCEAIIATLYAYRATGNEKYLDMHRRAHSWAFDHFPDRIYGEWYGYLHRDGSVSQPAKGNMFKGPFHVARMMIRSNRLIESILDR